MGKFEKQIERLKSVPVDYTFREAQSLLEHLGFECRNKGKTSGSRVRFFREVDGAAIELHKPHPGNVMKPYKVKFLIEYLKELGEIK